MIKILFICHGNICRSTMAEFLFRNMIKKEGLEDLFTIASAGTSTEEIGNPVHPGTKKKLAEHGISSDGKRAVQLKRSDYERFDYLIGMEARNVKNMLRILGHDDYRKVSRLLEFGQNPRDIADPWYTGDFEQTYCDIYEGCEELLKLIRKKMEIKSGI